MPNDGSCRLGIYVLLGALAGCGGGGGGSSEEAASSQGQSCMICHNGSTGGTYSGPGIENPHPFPGADMLACTTCHGGNPSGGSKLASHVPAPPEIGARSSWTDNGRNWFNRLTLAGIDKFADYQDNDGDGVGDPRGGAGSQAFGQTYTSLDYLQFVNPGDLRVVSKGRSCGQCHANHASMVSRSVLATQTGFFGGSMYFIGAENAIQAQQDLYDDTASDYAFRAVNDPNYAYDPQNKVGAVQNLLQVPVMSVFGRSGGMNIYRNPAYDSLTLGADLLPDNRVVTGSRLQHLFMEQVAFTCGDCHLGSAGANNRFGDFRSSGCTACHMRYSLDGQSRSSDPNVNKLEPIDSDDIDAPELAHVKAHRIDSTSKTLANGLTQMGIDDHTCAGCHQGSNRTVMQYWGIRLDQNQDVRNRFQYPANPVTYRNTSGDQRLFDPVDRNNTFNGRNANQYLLREDYDGDGRDDTPPDVHYDAGMGCIDCHGSVDLHGGNVANPTTTIWSHMEQQTTIQCENCHGTTSAYAQTQQGVGHDGTVSQLAVDRKGNLIKHVRRESDGHFYLYSKLDGARHFVPQTLDVTVDSGKTNPFSLQPVYNAKGSYAMGRDDGDPGTGTGPKQTGRPSTGFSHTDNMNCASCHASWSNTCVGCHLKGQYDEGANYSNITGERIVFKQRNADFTYQTPVPFQLGVNAHNKIAQVSANTKVFFQYRDRNLLFSQIFAFTDRNGGGNDPANGLGALGHNALLAHSIRGRVSSTNEGPRYCVACHLTTAGLATFGTQYDAFRTAMAARDYGALDFNLLQTHIGKNPGNQLDSPMWVHMVSGLGSGMFLFDKNGGPVNPLDFNANRFGSNGAAPGFNFNPANVAFDLDRIVEDSGFSFASNNHAMLDPGQGPNLRDGAQDPGRPGPLGASLVRKLADPVNGVVLDSWIDANAALQGDAGNYVR